MKKIRLIALALLCAPLALFAGCGLLDTIRNPYEVATELGYEGDKVSWIAENTEPSESWRLFREAQSDGYAGSFVDFLKEIGGNGKETASVNAALMSAVDVFANFRSASGANSGYISAGAGVIYSLDRARGDAYVITNYHILYSEKSAGDEEIAHISDNVTLYLFGNEREAGTIPAVFVGGAREYDIAVLRVEGSEILKNSSARAIEIADSDGITLGERVYAIGNPEMGGLSVSSGVISVLEEQISVAVTDDSEEVAMTVIRTDTPVNHGNSGGGLFDSAGRFVGITNSRSEKSGVEQIGYAIPSNIAVAAAQNIIDNASSGAHGVQRARLGITVQSEKSEAVYNEATGRAYIIETVVVKQVEFGGAAYGKVRAGDVVYSIRVNGGKERIVTRMNAIETALLDVRKGNTVSLVLSRGGKTETVDIDFTRNGDFTLLD